jgi:hypothetical protein
LGGEGVRPVRELEELRFGVSISMDVSSSREEVVEVVIAIAWYPMRGSGVVLARAGRARAGASTLQAAGARDGVFFCRIDESILSFVCLSVCGVILYKVLVVKGSDWWCCSVEVEVVVGRKRMRIERLIILFYFSRNQNAGSITVVGHPLVPGFKRVEFRGMMSKPHLVPNFSHNFGSGTICLRTPSNTLFMILQPFARPLTITDATGLRV